MGIKATVQLESIIDGQMLQRNITFFARALWHCRSCASGVHPRAGPAGQRRSAQRTCHAQGCGAELRCFSGGRQRRVDVCQLLPNRVDAHILAARLDIGIAYRGGPQSLVRRASKPNVSNEPLADVASALGRTADVRRNLSVDLAFWAISGTPNISSQAGARQFWFPTKKSSNST